MVDDRLRRYFTVGCIAFVKVVIVAAQVCDIALPATVAFDLVSFLAKLLQII